jgi:membrane-bound lytic murein transglycosylase MltF
MLFRESNSTRLNIAVMLLCIAVFLTPRNAVASLPEESIVEFCMEADCDYGLFYNYYQKNANRFCTEREVIINDPAKREVFSKILKFLKKEEMDLSLISLPIIESSLIIDARAEEHQNSALGAWQLKPATARDMGLRVDDIVDERLDVAKSTQAGIRYITWLLKRYEGQHNLAILAYHVGTGRLNRKIDEFGTTNPWFLSQLISEKNPDKNYLLKYYSYTLSLMGKNCD